MGVAEYTHYFRRTDPPPRRWHILRRSERYEVWQVAGEAPLVTMKDLDALLDARRYPADFWAAVHAADAAFAEGDRQSWIEFGTGRRVSDPGQTPE